MSKHCHAYLFLFMITFFVGNTHLLSAQSTGYNPEYPPNTFRSKENPMYWKNRMPHAGYWQQDVYYQIDATIDEQTGIIDGREILTYWNNSPDTLTFVYFHLYQQAFVKGGYLEKLNKENNISQTFGKYEAAGLGEVVTGISIDTKKLVTESDYSLMKAYLPEQLLPGDSVVFRISFKTYFDNGSQRRRMKKFNSAGSAHYDGVHWYPRICVYDSKFGWDTDQHLGKEFYGNFGTYNVKLSFSSNYIVGATGTLQNTEEVLPDSLMKKLELRNFAGKPWSSPASIIIPYDSAERKTWHFYAENVHDFAWTADPAYRIGIAYATVWDQTLQKQRKVLCQSLAHESHAAGWQDAASFTARLIEVLSRDLGTYAWPKIVVADARDGMEYPMLTLDGGFTPGYYDVIAHEVGHMWFFAQVGNNETYRAVLDEGFTQFAGAWALKHITGDTVLTAPIQNKYEARFSRPSLVMDQEVVLGYLQDAAKGTDESFNQHSDAFNSAVGHGGGYRHVYYKGATMLLNLQYVLGDSLFQQAMKHYFNQWKFCHPYPEDFRNSIIQFTHVDLNWFFDQWMESTKTIDYAISRVKKSGVDSFQIKFTRRGRSQMPLDFSVTAVDGNQYDFHIPNTWFTKKTTAMVLPKWYGWDRLQQRYSCSLFIPSGIKEVVIDPGFRLADIYMLNNYKKFPARLYFDSQVNNLPDWKQYQLYWRPDIWYNAVDGIKAGLHLEGNYFELKHKFSLTAWMNTTLLQNGIPKYDLEEAGFDSIVPVSFNFSYQTNTHRFIRNSTLEVSAKLLDGLWGGSGNFSIQTNANNAITLGVKSMYRSKNFDLNYLLYPEQWLAGNMNTQASLGLEHKYRYLKGNGKINALLRSSSLFSDYSYSDLTVTVINKNKLGKLDCNTRFIGRIGTGDPAPESELYLAGASPEELMESKFVRSKAFVPEDWLGYGEDINHFQQGGGLNLRGYSGYQASELNKNDSSVYALYSGKSGLAFSAELDFDNLIRFKPGISKSWLHVDTYLFADAGFISYETNAEEFALGRLRADAGFGFAFTIKRWGVLEKVKPFTLRVDLPLFVNRVPAASDQYFAFRYVVGIGRTF